MTEELLRYRFAYCKRGRLRHLGHLEVLGTIDRCVRRAGLPFAVTNGFSPRMKAQFSSALPVGCSSAAEYFDLFLQEELEVDTALERMRSATPQDLAPFACKVVVKKEPALEMALARSWWTCTLAVSDSQEVALLGQMRSIVEEATLEFVRSGKTKVVDLDKTLVGWSSQRLDGSVAGFGERPLVVRMDTRRTDAASLRPAVLVDEALARAGIEIGRPVRVARVAQWIEEDGYLMEPLGARRILDPRL